MSTLDDARAALVRHFGFTEFREGQDEVIQAVLDGEHAIVVMPTGGGKSLCYQLPAVMREGTTLVVSPLIALMKDQVDALEARGIAATLINSSLDLGEQRARLRAMQKGAYRLVYIAPERFRNERFVASLTSTPVSLLAVDEAHCISEWGHDFRPDYRRLGAAARQLGRPQIVALTATATPEVRADIAAQLELTDARQFVAGFDRPNLTLRVLHTRTEREKMRFAVRTVKTASGPGIVYAATRKSVEQVAAQLGGAGLNVRPYHAGLNDAARVAAHDAFSSGRLDAIVATNAFGMGIDKADIRFVLHYHLPSSIEAYYQEVGRAGRDGLPATCTLLFNYADTRLHQFFIDGTFPTPEFISEVYRAVVRLGPGAHTISASDLARRFGLKNDMAVSSSLTILERVGHVERSPGLQLSDETPVGTLRFDRAELARRAAAEQRKLRRVVEFGYHKGCFRAFVLRYFGDRRAARVCGMCGNCVAEPAAADADGATLRMPRAGPATAINAFIIENAPAGEALRDRLRSSSKSAAWQAEREVRLDDDPAPETGAARPLDDAETMVARKILSCVARLKERYGRMMVIAVLRGSRRKDLIENRLDDVSTYGLLQDMTELELVAWCDALVHACLLETSPGAYPVLRLTDAGRAAMRGDAPLRMRATPRRVQPMATPAAQRIDTVSATLALFERGLDVDAIAAERSMKAITIEEHLVAAVEDGRIADLTRLVPAPVFEAIEEAAEALGLERMKPVFDRLGGQFGYREIRLVFAALRRRARERTGSSSSGSDSR